MMNFSEVFQDCTKLGTKIKTIDYQETGKYAIVDQGQNLISGYTDNEEGVFTDVPVIIFGDHTRVIKYIDKPLFLGADGVKLLKSKLPDSNYKYLYYALKFVNIPNTGYNRHFKWLKEAKINYPAKEKQAEIVSSLDSIKAIIDKRQEQLEQFDILIKARFVEMFGNIQKAEKYSTIMLRNISKTISGGTPSTKNPDYYNGSIPWITTTSLGPNYIDGSTAKAYITESAIEHSATKLIQAGNILFGTRVGVGKSSINTVDICTNQDIVAIVNLDEANYNKLFIKYVLDSYQDYFDSIKKGATILGITSEDLKNVLVPVVSIDLQNKFADFVAQVDKSKVVVQNFFMRHGYYLID